MSSFWPVIIALMAGPDAGVPSAPTPTAPAPVAQGPAPSVEMDCAPNPVRMGDLLVCSVRIEHRSDFTVDVMAPDRFRVSKEVEVESLDSGLVKTVQTVEYRVRALKKVQVKGLKVRWVEPNKAAGVVEIPGQRIRYESLLISTLAKDRTPRTYRTPNPELSDEDEESQARADFLEKHGPIPFQVTNWTLIYVLGGLLILLVSPFVWMLINRIRRYFWPDGDGEDAPWVDPRPAHVIAYEQLHHLKEEGLPEQDLHEVYYVRISEIFRGYLKRRFHINGLEMTSEEIRRWSQSHVDAMVQQTLNDFLAETDIVKFANVVPNTEELQIITRQAETFIEQTMDAAEPLNESQVDASMAQGSEGDVSGLAESDAEAHSRLSRPSTAKEQATQNHVPLDDDDGPDSGEGPR